jgi:hypothetical protein
MSVATGASVGVSRTRNSTRGTAASSLTPSRSTPRHSTAPVASLPRRLAVSAEIALDAGPLDASAVDEPLASLEHHDVAQPGLGRPAAAVEQHVAPIAERPAADVWAERFAVVLGVRHEEAATGVAGVADRGWSRRPSRTSRLNHVKAR